MRFILSFLFIMMTTGLAAQHCPWDCSGLVILDWPENRKFSDYDVSLVDSQRKVVTNTNVYETTASGFLPYEELKEQLTEKISKHSWYEYDTALHFAKGSPVTLYNYCEYQQDLFVEVKSKKDPGSKHYFPLNNDQKFHLHNREHWQGKLPEEFDPKFKVMIRF